jgi:hypothetical protein
MSCPKATLSLRFQTPSHPYISPSKVTLLEFVPSLEIPPQLLMWDLVHFHLSLRKPIIEFWFLFQSKPKTPSSRPSANTQRVLFTIHLDSPHPLFDNHKHPRSHLTLGHKLTVNCVQLTGSFLFTLAFCLISYTTRWWLAESRWSLCCSAPWSAPPFKKI